MCVPGAIAATSAAIVMRNPADAARLPGGDTKTTTGVLDSMMAVLMSRVESTSPPGVRSDDDEEIGLRGIGLGDRPSDVGGRDRMDDAVDFGGVDDRLATVSLREAAGAHRTELGPQQDAGQRPAAGADETGSGDAHGVLLTTLPPRLPRL